MERLKIIYFGTPEFAASQLEAILDAGYDVAADPTIQKRTVRSLNDWPEDLGKYFYTIDIDPGYEMEGEEWVEVEKVGDRYYV